MKLHVHAVYKQFYTFMFFQVLSNQYTQSFTCVHYAYKQVNAYMFVIVLHINNFTHWHFRVWVTSMRRVSRACGAPRDVTRVWTGPRASSRSTGCSAPSCWASPASSWPSSLCSSGSPSATAGSRSVHHPSAPLGFTKILYTTSIAMIISEHYSIQLVYHLTKCETNAIKGGTSIRVITSIFLEN